MPNKKPAIAIGTIIILILIIWGTYSLFKPQIQDGDNLQTPQTQEEEDEFADWDTYSDQQIGLTLKYPHDVIIGQLDIDTNRKLILTVTKEKIELLNATMGYNKETALKDKRALNEGNFGEIIDFPTPPSKKVIKIGNKYLKSFMVLGRFEQCDTVLERKLIFYNNDYQIIITLEYTDMNELKSTMPEYFTDVTICSGPSCDPNESKAKCWTPNIGEKFYQTLVNGNGSSVIQHWYDVFERIIKTIEIDGTIGWKTYTNNQCGFKISYPKDYFYNYSISNDEFVLFDTEGVGTGLIIEIIEKSFEGRTVEIENWQSRGEKEFNNVIWNLFYKSGTEMVLGEWYKAIRQYKNENKLIEITLNRSTEELFNQILSTFKFID